MTETIKLPNYYEPDWKNARYGSLEELKEPCIKLTVFHPTDAEGVTAKTFVPKWEDRLQLACSGFTYVDVMNKGTNKGNSLKMIQDYYGISPEETMTFGDNFPCGSITSHA